MKSPLLVFIVVIIQSNTQQPNSNCPDTPLFQSCIQCSFNFWDQTHICICDSSKFQILNLCIEPNYPCKQTSLSLVYSNSSGNIFNKWDNQVAPFWVQTFNQTIRFSSLASPSPTILNNFDFNSMSDELKKGWTQAYFFYNAFISEIQALNVSAKTSLHNNTVNLVQKLVDQPLDNWWEPIVSQINDQLNMGYNTTVAQVKRKLSYQIQNRLPCHVCSSGYFLYGNDSNSTCRICSDYCSVCLNNSCQICADNYVLNNLSMCQYSGLACPNSREFSECYECMVVKNEHFCTCPKKNFSFLGKCIPLRSSCKITQLNSIYENSSGNIYNLWQTVIAPFWSSQLSIIRNIQLAFPTPSILNNFDFINMPSSLKRGWTQAYYLYQSFAIEISNLTFDDKINLYNSSINLAESLLDRNIEQWWVPTLNLFNQIAATTYTSISFQNLIKIRMVANGKIPCHFCMPQYGLIKKNGEQGCRVCQVGCIQCYQNYKICTKCAHGYTQHCPQYITKCQLEENCRKTVFPPSKSPPIDNIWFIVIIILVFVIIVLKRWSKQQEYEQVRRDHGDNSPSQIMN